MRGWKVFYEVTGAFNTPNHMPTKESITAAMPLVEQYVVFVYDRASTSATVDEASRDLFTRKGRAIESIPPTSAALLQHVKRAAYQAGHCWGQALVAVPDLSHGAGNAVPIKLGNQCGRYSHKLQKHTKNF